MKYGGCYPYFKVEELKVWRAEFMQITQWCPLGGPG